MQCAKTKGALFISEMQGSADRMFRVESGTMLNVVDDDGEWCRVVIPEQVGYCRKQYLEEVAQ